MKSEISRILSLAIPSIVTNITIPLLSIVDLAIVGRLGSASYIAAISLGGAMINLLYWNFGFLRMSTTGLTAQAYGARQLGRTGETLIRAISIALAASLALILLRPLVLDAVFYFTTASDAVEQEARRYFSICIFGAPAAISIYAFKGWLVGMQNTRATMVVALSVNIVNIALSSLFVFVLGMKVEGVALGTLISEYVGLAVCVAIYILYYRRITKYVDRSRIFHRIGEFFKVNVLIMVRNLCIIAVTTSFTFIGSKYGDEQLAVNTLLMQLFSFFSYFMDGFAYSGEALAGRYTGAQNVQRLHVMIRSLFMIGTAMAAIFTLIYVIGAEQILTLLTDNEAVLQASQSSTIYAAFIPFVSYAAFLWDGIMVGRTQIRCLVVTLVSGAVVFFASYIAMQSALGNDALWIAFLLYLLTRSLVQTAIRNQ